jgi:hypothetical protein
MKTGTAIIAGMLVAVFAGCVATDDHAVPHSPAARSRAIAHVQKHLHEAIFFAIDFQDRNDEHIAPHIETKFEQRACRALGKTISDMESTKLGLHDVETSVQTLLLVDEAAHCELARRIKLLPQ